MIPLLFLAKAGLGVSNGAFFLDSAGNYTARDSDGQAQSGTYTVYANGDMDWVGDAEGTNVNTISWWTVIGNPSGTWHVKMTYLNADGDVYTSGSGLGTWLELSTDRSWTFSRASVGGPDTHSATYTLEFSNDGGSTTYDSDVLTINLQESSP